LNQSRKALSFDGALLYARTGFGDLALASGGKNSIGVPTGNQLLLDRVGHLIPEIEDEF
jgi:hypothetical protein